MTYRILLGIDALALAVAVFFFLWGMGDGSVSSFNILHWMVLLGGLGAVVWGGIALHRAGRQAQAVSLLGLLAVPVALLGLFFLALIILQPRWN
ncbi:hypothetical protein [Sabulicella glaciei]|uniref:Osmoprotectant transporter permease n=1 Tax=Sabulicella glaciei TaxID=2984948 RepID=A0ABT3NV48_9PROT|nr:hypothetical protein [Roseococcus sp. MDT2-1-1]MCW8086035.1 hypothetical protein [Roseococcus sp. MDT2-1-1]